MSRCSDMAAVGRDHNGDVLTPAGAPEHPEAYSQRSPVSGSSWRNTRETYHLVGLRRGTATSKFYETRDNLETRVEPAVVVNLRR